MTAASSPTLNAGSRPQRTIAKEVNLSGRSLFHGYEGCITLQPAAENTGLVFQRTDLNGQPCIPATCEHVLKVPRRTAIGLSEDVRVETTEHLMSAFAGLQVDNCLVRIDAPELPAVDGSCQPFCDLILNAGIETQTCPAQFVLVGGPIQCVSSDGKQSLTLKPYLKRIPAITYHLDYKARSDIASQVYSIEVTPERFLDEIAAARTFVLESEIKQLQAAGFGKHLTAKDIVVVSENGVIDNEWRWPDEAVRHKILDLLGDLALSGAGFHGHVTATRSGHHLNHKLAYELNERKQNLDTRGAKVA